MDPIGMVEENISFWQHCHAADYRSMVEAMSCDDPEEAVFWQQEQAIDHERAWYSLNQLINPI
jgi:hypothetical protein